MFDEELITWSIDGGGRLFYRPRHKFSVTNVGGTLRILDNDFLDCRYLHLVLTHLHSKIRFDWVYKAHPSVIRMVYNDIPVPTLKKQQNIVEKLDNIFAQIHLLELNLELSMKAADELFQSILNSELSPADADLWQEVSLKEICDVDWGNTKLTKSSYIDNGSYLAVSAAGADGLIDHFEHEPDVPVLSAIGAQCGRMFFPGARFTAIKNTITLTPIPGVSDGKFLYYLFTYVNLPQRGAGQPFISKGDIEVFRVCIPKNLETQGEIVEKLDGAFLETELLRSQLKLQKDLAGALRQSLLSSAFNGMDEVA